MSYRRKKYHKKRNNTLGTAIFILILLFYAVSKSGWNYRKQIEAIFPAGILIIAFVILILFFIPLVSAHLKRRQYLNSNLHQIDQMSGTEFEEYLKVHFEKLGYHVKHVGQAGDFGADLILSKDGVKRIVQAKRYREKVSVGAVQQVISAKEYYRGQQAMVVTNSYFTKSAVEMAQKCGVILWNREDCRKWFVKI